MKNMALHKKPITAELLFLRYHEMLLLLVPGQAELGSHIKRFF